MCYEREIVFGSRQFSEVKPNN